MNETSTTPNRSFKTWLDSFNTITNANSKPAVTLALKALAAKAELTTEELDLTGIGFGKDTDLVNARVIGMNILSTVMPLFITEDEKYLYVSVRNSDSKGYSHLNAHIVHFEKEWNKDNPFTINGCGLRFFSDSDTWKYNGYLWSIVAECQMDDRSDHAYASDIRYTDVYSANASKLEAMLKTAKRCEAFLARHGYEEELEISAAAKTFYRHAIALAEAAGCVGLVVDTGKVEHRGLWTFHQYERTPLSYAMPIIDALVQNELTKLNPNWDVKTEEAPE